MNNNRGNNRRRGRGNRQQGGGGQQLNRIDSRARGNAPQLLEKYRKLAHDAHLNGDRVQAEYYLQFADHYFRVLADSRQRQEEQRSRAQGERWQEGADEGEDSSEFGAESDFPSFDQPGYQQRPQRGYRQGQDDRDPRREERYEREDEPARAEEADQGGEEAAQANPYEPVENPFVRENRGTRGLRPRREDRRPRREERDEDAPAGLDPASLPPAISAVRIEVEEGDGGEAAKPRRGRPRKKPAADESLESVN